MDELTLNQQIAAALGYRVNYDRDRGYWLIRPDGSEVGEANEGRQAYLEAYYASGEEASTWELVPDFEHDLNAVLEALPREWYDIRIGVDLVGGYHATIYQDDPPMGYKHKWEAKGQTRQSAAACALLAWATSIKQSEPAVK